MLHHPRHAEATDDVSPLALYHLVSLCGIIPEDSWWGMSLVWVSLCLHRFYCEVLCGTGGAEQGVQGSAQSRLSEGLTLVKLPPEHRPGVVYYRQTSCCPHLTGFSFQLQDKGGN